MIKQTNAYEFSVDKSDSFNSFSSNSTGLHKKMRHSQEQNVRKGAWTSEEDMLLKKYIEKHGEGKWRQVPLRAGLRRCRKSCRLRWLNYLRPNIKRGNFEEDEIDLILRLHKLLGNRWSLIAGRVPGRTANDIKNFWNTHLRKKLRTDKKYFMKNDHSGDSNRATTVIRPKTVVPSANSEWLRKLRATTNTKSPSTQEISPQSLFVPAIENEDEWWHCLLNEKTVEESSNDITTDSMNFSTEIDELCRSIDGFGEKKDGEDRIVYFDECGDLLLNNEFFAP